MPLVILHHLLNVFVQLANKRGLKKNLAFRNCNQRINDARNVNRSVEVYHSYSRKVYVNIGESSRVLWPGCF
jgi:hypothetical protein